MKPSVAVGGVMCDMGEEEYLEYLLWVEAVRARSRSEAERAPAAGPPIRIRPLPVPPVAAES